MVSVYLSVHRLQVLCHILPWDFKTQNTGSILFISYTDAYIEFRKDLVSRGDCGSERVKRVEVPGASKEHFLPQRPDRQPNDEFRPEQLNYVRCAIAESWMLCQLTGLLVN